MVYKIHPDKDTDGCTLNILELVIIEASTPYVYFSREANRCISSSWKGLIEERMQEDGLVLGEILGEETKGGWLRVG